jgi:hypothetical protein
VLRELGGLPIFAKRDRARLEGTGALLEALAPLGCVVVAVAADGDGAILAVRAPVGLGKPQQMR